MSDVTASEPALRMRGISKRFGGVHALSDVSLDVAVGEVHALVGQNGSGKSTLVKILTGYHTPSPGGSIQLWGEELSLPVRGALGQGIAVIHQALGLVDGMSVLENLSVGTRFGAGAGGPINWSRERRTARELLVRFGLELDLDVPTGRISPGERAMLAIVRAVRQLEASDRPRALFILDEPSVYLSRGEVDRLGALIRGIAAGGSSVLYISHRLREVHTICDRITVIRDGRVVETLASATSTDSGVLRLMIGRDIGSFYPDKRNEPSGKVLLRAAGVSGKTVRDVSLSLRAGEVLGCTGLVGMGQDELPYLLLGAQPSVGEIELVDAPAGTTLTPRRAPRLGVAFSPADRLAEGGWGAGTAAENATLPVLGRYFRRIKLDRGREAAEVKELMTAFRVTPPRPGLMLANFSGGNQQKVLLAKWLQSEPQILLLHEPTQGVDAAAKKEVLEMIASAAARGAGVMVFSSDYEQLAHICDRVLVFQRGETVAELGSGEITEDRIVEACHAV